MAPDFQPKVDVGRHTKYFLRCLKTYLPTAYQSNDSNRMSLAFFTLAGLDLLGTLDNNISAEQRSDYIAWIYALQHPSGGFRAFPGTDLGPDHTTPLNAHWDPANLPATYFALSSLLVLGDDLRRVARKETLAWLKALQRPDGSFGETIGQGGTVHGGTDSRFGYCAMSVRFILRGNSEEGSEAEGVADVDLDAFVECIRAAETYDGGISDAPFHEAHAGFTYCTVAALNLTGRLDTSTSTYNPPASSQNPSKSVAPTHPARVLHWLVSRQTATISPEDEDDTYGDETDTPETCHDAHTFVHQEVFVSKRGKESFEGRPSHSFDVDWTGFNGRCNKIADTCYAFWVGASLNIMNHSSLTSTTSLRRYLLEKTAHRTLGGFGKLAGDLPDIYHSCLGLAALSLTGDEDLKALDASLCISQEARGRLDAIWARWGRASCDSRS
ncbi:hypothetical protein AAFC00_003607 [Neodothiora populina]|uniref:Prenyltransferase alpha-alpha toroid domain-containing protein n=1 Tax=Neodothiora populina TaxID=2781224 RepID=A0ABR3PET0_9PEZI